MPAPRPLHERFWEKVDTSGDCWLWTASREGSGYGVIGDKRKNLKAHRVSWTFTFGEIPEKMEVCHTCDTPACVKPDHLFLGSHLDNMRDMYAKGRRQAAAGERHGRSTLTWPVVREIRTRAASGEPILRIAKRLGIPRRTVGNVAFRRTWVTDPLGDTAPMPVVRRGRPRRDAP